MSVYNCVVKRKQDILKTKINCKKGNRIYIEPIIDNSYSTDIFHYYSFYEIFTSINNSEY